ncbi:MAG: S41 family peptidase, partial [Bacteroidota bacterium]
MKRFNLKLPLLVLAIFTIAFTAFIKPQERYFEIVKNLDIFATLFKEVNTYYVDEVNPNQLIETGIDAMLRNLDPYTNYIPEDAIEDYRTLTTGEYGGIGALVGKREGKNLVIMPYKGFPAEKAGLKIGDKIVKIDGIEVNGKTTTEISKLLKGQSGTEITLTIERYNREEPFDISMKREKIIIDNVPYYGMVTENIGYLKLSDFTTNASKEVRKAVVSLKNDGAEKIILDLRGNPGGLLNEAVNISNIFIPKGSEVVSTKGKVKDWNKTYKALDNPLDTEIPLAVLTNSRSASASEIVAGVIQDYDRGILVGQKTFGKGLVQATRPLTYNSQLKVTTAKYYIPSGRCIQAIDYSHRNEDGSVGKIPDSLKTAFTTQNGRVVYDGGGVDPDVEVKELDVAPITLSLVSKSLMFDYATQYYYSHDEITDPDNFQLSDSEYQEFIDWLSGKDYSYETKTESKLSDLRELFEEESFYDEVKTQLYKLKEEINLSKQNDLEEHRGEIKEYLEEEIVSRYYFEDGAIQASFDFDPD